MFGAVGRGLRAKWFIYAWVMLKAMIPEKRLPGGKLNISRQGKNYT